MSTIDGGNQNKNTRQRLRALAITLLLVSCIACGAAFYVIVFTRPKPTPESLATQEAETLLTEMYGETVRNAVKNRWLIAHSLEVDQDPAIRSQVETGRWLEYWSVPPGAGDTEPFHLVTKSVSVGKVRVLEYEPERRFKAVVCIVKQNAEVTPEGELLQLLPPEARQGVHVFLYEDDTWKLAGYFETTDYENSIRDWWYAPEWLKEIIQELPDWEPCG